MKKLQKFLSFLLAVIMLFAFTACGKSEGNSSGSGEVVISLDGYTLTESEYMYLLAYVKAMVVYNQQNNLYQYTGTVYEEADILAMPVDDDTTIADYIKEYSVELAQQLLIMEKLADTSGISITNQEDIDTINNYVADIEYAYGGTDLFEIALTRMGFSRSGIERFQKFSVLYELLSDYRYGENGVAKIPDETISEYFTENYLKYDGVLYSYTGTDGSNIVFEFAEEELSEYFYDNYTKVCHILYLTKNLSDDNKAEKKAKAEAAFDSIKNGEKTIEDLKSENEDNGFEYTFTYGEMVEAFENAAFEMEVDEVRLVETEYGYHIVKKLPMTDTDLNGTTDEEGKTTGGIKSTVLTAMSKAKVRNEALETLNKLQNGELSEYPEENTDTEYYVHMSSQFVDKTESGNAYLVSVIGDKEKDTYIEHEISGDGTYIMRNLSFDADDITAEIYTTINNLLSVEAFSEYTKTFYDNVQTNNDLLEKFDVMTIPMLEEEFYTE